MMDVKSRLQFYRSALTALQKAYLALLDGGVKSYTIDDRTLTRFDLDKLSKEIAEMERKVAELEALATGRRPRAVFGVIPRDSW